MLRTKPLRQRVLIGIASGLFIFSASCMAGGELTGVNPVKHCLPKQLVNAADLDLDQFKGKVVYLDFWASWCGPCKASFPFMNELQKELKSEGLVVVALSIDEDANDAKKFLKKVPANFEVAIDSGGTCPEEFQIRGMPSSYILGKNGEIIYQHEGFKKSDAEKLKQVVASIVKDQQ